MAESGGAVGRDHGVKKSWSFTAGSISAELKAACQQLVADSSPSRFERRDASKCVFQSLSAAALPRNSWAGI